MLRPRLIKSVQNHSRGALSAASAGASSGAKQSVSLRCTLLPTSRPSISSLIMNHSPVRTPTVSCTSLRDCVQSLPEHACKGSPAPNVVVGGAGGPYYFQAPSYAHYTNPAYAVPAPMYPAYACPAAPHHMLSTGPFIVHPHNLGPSAGMMAMPPHLHAVHMEGNWASTPGMHVWAPIHKARAPMETIAGKCLATAAVHNLYTLHNAAAAKATQSAVSCTLSTGKPGRHLAR